MIKIIFIIVASIFLSHQLNAHFYVKLKEAEANNIIQAGINEFFGAEPQTFDVYSDKLIDPLTNDVYWTVINIKKGNFYDIENWFINTYPDIEIINKNDFDPILKRIRENDKK